MIQVYKSGRARQARRSTPMESIRPGYAVLPGPLKDNCLPRQATRWYMCGNQSSLPSNRENLFYPFHQFSFLDASGFEPGGGKKAPCGEPFLCGIRLNPHHSACALWVKLASTTLSEGLAYTPLHQPLPSYLPYN